MKNKILPIISIITASAIMTAGISLAGFMSVKEIAQTVGSAGQAGYSIYLKPGMWEVDGALFYVYQWNATHQSGGDSACWISSSKKTAEGYYVFLLKFGNQYTGSGSADADQYLNFKFVRINPNGANIPSFDSGTLWNESNNLSFSFNGATLRNNDSNSNNGFAITNWDYGSWNFNVS